MVRTVSTMLPLGTQAPDFNLLDTTGKMVRRDDFLGNKGLLVMFLCNHCPYVIHIRAHLSQWVKEKQAQGLSVVGINANDASSYPEDSPQEMQQEVLRADYSFPYLFDTTQAVAKSYRAACTPDFFLFDATHQLVYRGQYDESRPKNDVPVSGADLERAVSALLNHQPLLEEQWPSMGCNIKWKAGQEPDYFG
jgi:peroxiredoxin